MISTKSPWLGHVTPVIKKIKIFSLILVGPLSFYKHTTPNTFQCSFFIGTGIVLTLEAFRVTLDTFNCKQSWNTDMRYCLTRLNMARVVHLKEQFVQQGEHYLNSNST